MTMAEDSARAKSRHSLPALSGARGIVVALALLGIVALASTSRVESGGSPPHSRTGVIALAVAAASAVVVIVLAGILLTGYASFAETRTKVRAGLVVLVVALLLTALVAALLWGSVPQRANIRCESPVKTLCKRVAPDSRGGETKRQDSGGGGGLVGAGTGSRRVFVRGASGGGRGRVTRPSAACRGCW
jgi:hypothetical protein